MNPEETIELAKAYVALSNAHRLQLIPAMLKETSVYQSSAVGSFKGSTEIMKMMQGFFSRYPDVYWQVSNYELKQNEVHFEFEMSATDSESDEPLLRKGIEIIAFDKDGKIDEIRVDTS